MGDSIPLKPTGSNYEAYHAQKVHEKVFGPVGKLRNTSTVKFDKRHNGIFARVKPAKGGGSSGLLGPFQIESVHDDYLTCYAYDPVNEIRTGTMPIYIAKEDKQQNSLITETIFGIIHNYTYQAGTAPPGGLAPADANNVFRTDTYGANNTVEYQRIVPPWACGAKGEIVWANSATTGVEGPGGPVTLLIAGRSCQWGVVFA